MVGTSTNGRAAARQKREAAEIERSIFKRTPSRIAVPLLRDKLRLPGISFCRASAPLAVNLILKERREI
jgi:hypothetical protein